MRLTPSFLKDVKYWEHRFYQPWAWSYQDKFTFHFKQWWKPSKVIKFKAYEEWSGTTCYFHQTASAKDLLNQLYNHKFE